MSDDLEPVAVERKNAGGRRWLSWYYGRYGGRPLDSTALVKEELLDRRSDWQEYVRGLLDEADSEVLQDPVCFICDERDCTCMDAVEWLRQRLDEVEEQ